MKSKIPSEESTNERAVSPVIGVILMVAITVILAAVIAAFVLDLGQSSGANPSAGFTYDQSNNETTVQLNTVDRVDSVTFRVAGDCDTSGADVGEDTNPQVGDTWTFSPNNSSSQSCDPGDITIVGEYDGNEATL
ncbi:type IV pilin [Natronosalvus hydrolyticus]